MHHTSLDPGDAFAADLAAHDRTQAQSGSLWAMTNDERIAAMRRGDLSLGQLLEWARRAPQSVPKIDGEFEFIVVTTTEWLDRNSPGFQPPSLVAHASAVDAALTTGLAKDPRP